MPRIDAFLQIMSQVGASDLHIGDGSEPLVRINGVLEKTKHKSLSVEEVRLVLYELLTDRQIERFEETGEIDIAYTLENFARFRVNIFKKHPGLAAAFRLIPKDVPTLDTLGFPEILKEMLAKRSGLILVTGPTNSGKTTTLAAMVDHLNEHMNYHIITLEDPLEFIHPNKNCLIHQRQIGEHSLSFSNALALTAAEVGLLVLGTLHTKSASQTIGRVIDAFPVDQQPQVRLALSEVLVGVCSQQLLRRADGVGRTAALEIMVRNHAVANLIREAKTHQIANTILMGRNEGMQLMDDHLKQMISQELVTAEEAARFSENPQAILAHGKSVGASPQIAA